MSAEFVEAARRLEGTTPLPGLLRIDSVDPNGRWVVHGAVVGPLTDFKSLGWKLPRKLELFVSLCNSIAELHKRELPHGNITPWNVALDEDIQPALVSPSGPSIWAAGDGFEYIAPELLMGALPTPRSDIYSLGRMITFLLLADHPAQEKDEVPKLDYLEKSPAGLTRIIRRATLADPALRYGTIAELLADIKNYGDFEKVGLALATAIELNKTGLSHPPAAVAQQARREAKPTAAVPAPTKVYVPPVKPPRTKLFFGLLALFVVMAVIGFGDPIFQAVQRWRARSNAHAASPVEKGQAIARSAAMGDRDLSGSSLAGVDFSGAPLTGVNLSHADLSGAKLDQADLAESDFTGAILTGASAFGANMSGVVVSDAQGVDTVVCDKDTLPPTGWQCVGGHLAQAAVKAP
jgi:hypothetical protein